MTPAELFVDAYAKSKKNQPGKIAAEGTELLGVANRALRSAFLVAARVNPFYYMDEDDVTYSAPGWARPAAAEAIYRIELNATGNEVVVVPFDDRAAESGTPAVYRSGGIFKSAGNAGDPESTDDLRFFFSRIPTDAATTATPMDTAYPVAYRELLVLEIAIYLARKDGRMDEADILKGERDSWLQMYLAHLEHEVLNERGRWGQLEPFRVPSLVPISSLFQGGSSVEV